jgi:hypothetical protein
MANLATCPGCARELQVPSALLGQKIRCPGCLLTLQSEPSEQGVTLIALPAAPPPTPEPAPPTPKVSPLPSIADDRVRRHRRRDVEPHRGTLMVVLGVLSFFLCPPLLGPIAWLLATADLKKIRAGLMDPAGESPTHTGRVCGIIATVLGLIGLLLCAFVVGSWVYAASTVGRQIAPPRPVPIKKPQTKLPLPPVPPPGSSNSISR